MDCLKQMIRTILTHTLVMAGLLMAVPATAQKDTLKNKLNLDMTLGHSFEFMLSYTFTQDIKLTLGYTHMLGTETMVRLKKEG